MNHALRLLPLLPLAACALSAQTVLSDDFDSYAVGNLPQYNINTNPSGLWLNRTVQVDYRIVQVTSDTNGLFGGTGNQYLHLQRNSGATADLNAYTVPASTALAFGELSFDFHVASGSIASDSASGYRLTLLSNTTTNVGTYTGNNTSTGLYFTDGEIHLRGTGGAFLTGAENTVSYTTGQANNLRLVYNLTDSTQAYAGGSVASGFMDLYLNNAKVATWALGSGSTGGVGNAINAIWFAAVAGASNATNVTGGFDLDNLSLAVPAAVPEPSAFAALAGLGVLGLALGRRRAKRV